MILGVLAGEPTVGGGNDWGCAGRGTSAPSRCLGYIACMIDEQMNEYK